MWGVRWMAVGVLAAGCAVRTPAPPVAPALPDAPPGIESALVGDVSADAAVLWARSAQAGPLRVELRDESGRHALGVAGESLVERDRTARFDVRGLEPRTRYRYRFGGSDAPWAGAFVTAPRADDPAPVRFAFGGDVGGQDACRDAATGYAIFDVVAERTPDFFVGLGDMIYADSPCSETGRYGNAQLVRGVDFARDLDGYRAHWRYNRADPPFRRLMARTSYVAVWDDHETINDAGPLDDAPAQAPYQAGAHLLPVALRAFLEQNPLRESAETPERLYRALRWGKHLEVFVLDTRQYRDSDRAPDADDAPKTMLGREQRAWLERRLAESDATWKIVVSSVPISLPTGSARKATRDGWASHGTETGYERELGAIFETVASAGVRNLVFITTDVHFGAVFRYRPLPEHREFEVYELATGPLWAGLWRTEVFDPTFHPERLALHAAQQPLEVATLDEARRWFNFGDVAIDAGGRLVAELVDGYGESVFELTLDPD
jgi:alkaline phosphatase D